MTTTTSQPTNSKWCDCGTNDDGSSAGTDGEFFVDGEDCSCGTSKEHQHCVKCGGFTQVG